MTKKKIGIFLKIIIVLFAISSLICILGRDNFIVGTILIFGRWFFIVFGIILLYLSSKKKNANMHRLILLISLALFLSEFMWIKFKQENLNQGTSAIPISLMSYNLFFKNKTPNSSIQKIKESDTDILVIQELTPQLESHLLNSIKEHYPYRKIRALRGTHGIGIYSKYPILKCEYLENEGGLPYAQIVEILVEKKLIQIINVHLASPAIAVENPDNFLPLLSSNYQLREKQLLNIQSVTQQNEFHAQILIGDLNTISYEPIMRSLNYNWVNLFDIAGYGSPYNFPHTNKFDPIFTLDYIMIRGIVKGIDANVVKGGSSDHLPIIGKIEI